jgi:aldose 1-epimerase
MMAGTKTVALVAGAAEVVLAPRIGGAIAGFTWHGQPVLRALDAEAVAAGDVRRLACFPLVPYSNRIRDARLRVDGRVYALAHNFGDHPHSIHGIGWQRPWEVAEHGAQDAELVLEHDAADDQARRGWPWPFVALQRFRLEAGDGHAELAVDLAVQSRADAPFPVGLGWHPYFPRSGDTRVGFEAASVWLNDATQLPRECCPVPAAWCFDPPKRLDGNVLDQVFNGWTGEASVHQRGLVVTLHAGTVLDRLVVYAPAGRDSVAVEPVSHETDAFNRAAAGVAHTGTRMLAPGGTFGCSMRLTVSAP